MQLWGDNLVSSWKNRKVKGLCEDNASGKVFHNIYQKISYFIHNNR